MELWIFIKLGTNIMILNTTQHFNSYHS